MNREQNMSGRGTAARDAARSLRKKRKIKVQLYWLRLAHTSVPHPTARMPPRIMPTTAILMVDTNSPKVAMHGDVHDLLRTQGMQYQALAAWINQYYARRHGYALIYYKLAEFGCRHVIWGSRHPSYCKLPAIADALQKYSRVAMIDSDAWFDPMAPSLRQLLLTHPSPRFQRGSSLYFASDWPFSSGPNCGLMIWQRSESARALLRLWWHLDPGPYANAHDYEQRALHWVLSHLLKYRGTISGASTASFAPIMQTLRLRPFALSNASDVPLVVHADHTRRGERLWRLGLAILTLASSSRSRRATPRRIARKTLREQNSMLELTNSTGLVASMSAETTRLRILDAALSVMRSFRHWPIRKGEGMGASRRSGRHPRTIRVHAQGFNATDVAIRLLPPLSRSHGFPAGLSLVLRPCGPSRSRWQQWRLDNSSASARDACKLASEKARSTSKVRDATGPVGIRLMASPCLCAAVGSSRPLKQPRETPVAQLLPCSMVVGMRHAHGSRNKNSRSTKRYQLGKEPGALWEIWASDETNVSHGGEEPLDALIDDGTIARMEADERAGGDVEDVFAHERQALARFLERNAEATLQQLGVRTAQSNVRREARSTRHVAIVGGPFAGKHGSWRRAHANHTVLFQPCRAGVPSTFSSLPMGGANRDQGTSVSWPDKVIKDCEAWCRPSIRAKHCKACKCMACYECTSPSPQLAPRKIEEAVVNGDSASIETGVGAWEVPRPIESLDQGRSQLCLGTWKGDLPLDGTPLVFAPCLQPRMKPKTRKLRWQRTVTQQQQQWIVDPRDGRMRARHAPHLCVTATPLHVAMEEAGDAPA